MVRGITLELAMMIMCCVLRGVDGSKSSKGTAKAGSKAVPVRCISEVRQDKDGTMCKMLRITFGICSSG
jgi:hypothetical protein